MYRLDEWLVKKGLFESRRRASKFIKEIGVLVNGKHITKPSYRITPPIDFQLDQSKIKHYNKPQGYHKLAHVAQHPEIIPFNEQSTCLDIGANVGGFSQFLLEQGVKSVDAIEISPHYKEPLQKLAEKWPNFSYTIANYFDISRSLPKKYTVITADITIDPYFLLQNVEKFFYPLTRRQVSKQVLLTVKLGKNMVNLEMTTQIEITLRQTFPKFTFCWIDSLSGRQEKILLAKQVT